METRRNASSHLPQSSGLTLRDYVNLGVILRSELFKEADDRFNPAVEVRDVELLVGGVEVVVGQAEAHHDAGNFEHVLKIGDDGNGAAGADENCIFFEDLVQRFRRGLD